MDATSKYISARQTLRPGGEITISGTRISVASPATALVIGSTAEALPRVSTTSRLADLIMSSFNGSRNSPTSVTSKIYTGSVFTGAQINELQARSYHRYEYSWFTSATLKLNHDGILCHLCLCMIK